MFEYLGWVAYHFGYSTIWPFLLGRGGLGRIGWVDVLDGGKSKSVPTQPRNETTRVACTVETVYRVTDYRVNPEIG